ncbi:uncharacterized protein [Clytia hemisphaerica]|uniref:uncharacterized protein n=1 Tax=Clytia hemisphaerica TaxID=252671 RepID=UPI0034D3D569
MAFKEWCFCQHKIHILQKKKWIECPSCTHVQHSCHVDGNYVQGKGEADFICGGKWNAARNKASTKKSLDVTGLEVMSCRHQLGQRALNMHRGEIYGYPLYLIREHLSTRNMKFVYADIMCKLSKLIKRVDAETANKFTGALSVMHAKGHGIDCQFIWDGKWIDGTGRSTGEETEQIFSYMSRFCNTTKYQKPESKT